MNRLKSVTWNISSFPSDEAAAEFDQYIAYFQSEWARWGDNDQVTVHTTDRGPRHMQGWAYRQYLVGELEDVIFELTGEEDAVLEHSIYEPEETPAPEIHVTQSDESAAGIMASSLQRSQQAQAAAAKRANAAIRDAWIGK